MIQTQLLPTKLSGYFFSTENITIKPLVHYIYINKIGVISSQLYYLHKHHCGSVFLLLAANLTIDPGTHSLIYFYVFAWQHKYLSTYWYNSKNVKQMLK